MDDIDIVQETLLVHPRVKAAFDRIEADLARKDAVIAEAKNRRHYSDNPRTTLHSWSDQEALGEIGAYCRLCAALAGIK